MPTDGLKGVMELPSSFIFSYNVSWNRFISIPILAKSVAYSCIDIFEFEEKKAQ